MSFHHKILLGEVFCWCERDPAGGLFGAFGSVLSWLDGMRWTIYDLPAVIARGEELNAARKSAAPRFTSSLESYAGADVLLASGSPQYCDAEFGQTVLGLQIRPRHVLINQVPLHDGEQFVTLQNIESAYCPYWVRNREDFLRPLLGAGYELVDLWTNPGKECRIPTYPRQTRPEYFGAYLRLEAPTAS